MSAISLADEMACRQGTWNTSWRPQSDAPPTFRCPMTERLSQLPEPLIGPCERAAAPPQRLYGAADVASLPSSARDWLVPPSR
jgi:hypothetical protein